MCLGSDVVTTRTSAADDVFSQEGRITRTSGAADFKHRVRCFTKAVEFRQWLERLNREGRTTRTSAAADVGEADTMSQQDVVVVEGPYEGAADVGEIFSVQR